MESENKKSALGILALVFGIIGMLLSCIAIGVVPSIVGFILAIVAITRKDQKHGLAIAGLVCSVIGIGIFLLGSMIFGTDDSDSSTVVGGSGSQTEINSEIEDAGTTVDNVEEVDLASQMTVEEYHYENTIGATLYFMIVTNNSTETVSIDVNSIAKDAEGKTIGATTTSEEAVGSGETVCLTNYFSDVEDAASFEYTMTVKKDAYFDSVANDLAVEESRTDKKVILTCTNNGDKAADFVEAYALFFLNGELIGYDSTYIVDSDSEIKPGATISDEVSCYKGYDDVKVFVHGRR